MKEKGGKAERGCEMQVGREDIRSGFQQGVALLTGGCPRQASTGHTSSTGPHVPLAGGADSGSFALRHRWRAVVERDQGLIP